jgi:hypothetical protein
LFCVRTATDDVKRANFCAFGRVSQLGNGRPGYASSAAAEAWPQWRGGGAKVMVILARQKVQCYRKLAIARSCGSLDLFASDGLCRRSDGTLSEATLHALDPLELAHQPMKPVLLRPGEPPQPAGPDTRIREPAERPRSEPIEECRTMTFRFGSRDSRQNPDE